MSDRTIEQEAWDLIKNCKGKSLTMIGLPYAHNDPTMSPPVASKCDRCGEELYSTKLKEKIKELTLGAAVVLCGKCLQEEIKKYGEHEKIYSARIPSSDREDNS